MAGLFENIRKFKFVRASQTKSLVLVEYPDYLFESSLDIIEEIHSQIFVDCI